MPDNAICSIIVAEMLQSLRNDIMSCAEFCSIIVEVGRPSDVNASIDTARVVLDNLMDNAVKIGDLSERSSGILHVMPWKAGNNEVIDKAIASLREFNMLPQLGDGFWLQNEAVAG
jgi:hypothetical protein